MRTYDIRGAPAEEPGSGPTGGCINRFPISGPYTINLSGVVNSHYGADPGELLVCSPLPVRQDGTPH
ncbi:hypothetical protein BT69DRAFT_1280990 [Atractiella rhizophila]|nr:hypothetical protein BT69DRAFT_1280990 [Atractiella rhizophila]